MTHLIFKEFSSTSKTKKYNVYSAHDGSNLGMVAWYGGWRQYVFYPQDGVMWSHDCLTELAAYMKKLMEARK